MRAIILVAVGVPALCLAACGSGGSSVDVGGGAASGTSAVVDRNQLFEANATVLEEKGGRPMLCLGGILLSLPPRCGEVPVSGWDWQAVEGEESAGGTVWGRYRLEGEYDGDTFAVTDVGPYEEDDPSADGLDPDFTSPCREPGGGWSGLENATQEDARLAHAYARRQDDFVTSWVSHLKPALHEFGPVIVNAVFTGDRERHEAEIRKVWDGPLCVVERDVLTARELRHIRMETEANLDDLGLQMLWSQGPAVDPIIEIGVIVDPERKGQAALDARYGRGVVLLAPALKLISN